MTISAQEVYLILKKRYPNAEVFVLDLEYTVPERKEVVSLFSKFQRALKFHKLLKWVSNIFDCDNFAWNFKGTANAHRATGDAKLEIPIGFLCYFIGADKSKGHAINCAIWLNGDGSQILELEPQGEGIKSLTKEERESAWLVIV